MASNTFVGAVCALLVIPAALMQNGPGPQHATEQQDPQASAHALARFEAVEQFFQHLADLQKAGHAAGMAIEDEVRWSLRYVDAAVAAGKMTAAEACTAHLERVQRKVRSLQSLHEAGRVSFPELAKARYHLADAKLRLANAPQK
ncbi:MAG: hypothetical protein ACE37K_01410 [Planctomycetota bacterium]